MSDLNVAILGCGRMGRERARCVSALGATITAVYDPDGERAAALAAQFGCSALDSESEVPWRNLDAIFFCTPPQRREAQALAAIAAGVSFLAEKPVGLSHQAAARVASVLARAPIVNAIGYMNRCRRSVQLTRALLADTRLLGLAGFWVCRQYAVPWWLDPAASGGPLNEQATHLFDLFRVFGGEIASVQAISANPALGAESLGCASTVQFHSGSIGTVFYSCESSGKSIGLHLFTDRGSVELAGWDFRIITNTIDANVPEQVGEEDVFLLETEQFLHAVRTGSPEDVACDWIDAMRTQAAVDAARTCLDENRLCETAAIR